MWNKQPDGKLTFTINENEMLKTAFLRCVNHQPSEPDEGFWLAMLSITSQFIANACDDPAGSLPPGSILRWENRGQTLTSPQDNSSETDL